jgi:hypothetical protein
MHYDLDSIHIALGRSVDDAVVFVHLLLVHAFSLQRQSKSFGVLTARILAGKTRTTLLYSLWFFTLVVLVIVMVSGCW